MDAHIRSLGFPHDAWRGVLLWRYGARQSVLNMLMLSAAALSVTAVVWTLWGWSIAYAGSSIGGIFGDPATGFLLKDTMVFDAGTRQYTAAGLAANGNKYPSSVDVSFQVTFAMITVALICGAIAERVKYSTWMLFVALWVTFDYAPMAHMVWNNGLLSAKGPISTAIAPRRMISQEARSFTSTPQWRPLSSC